MDRADNQYKLAMTRAIGTKESDAKDRGADDDILGRRTLDGVMSEDSIEKREGDDAG